MSQIMSLRFLLGDVNFGENDGKLNANEKKKWISNKMLGKMNAKTTFQCKIIGNKVAKKNEIQNNNWTDFDSILVKKIPCDVPK